MDFFDKYIELAISICLSVAGFSFLYGKHVSSVKGNEKKNQEQDEAIKDIFDKLERREDVLRSHIDAQVKHLDAKLDIILGKFGSRQ